MQRPVVTLDHAGDTRQRLAFRLSQEPQMELRTLLNMPYMPYIGDRGSIPRTTDPHRQRSVLICEPGS